MTTPTPDWEALRATALAANFSADQIKKALPIAFVLQQEGYVLSAEGDKLVTLCPFHHDTNPSLDIYGADLDRFGCFACGASGDVLDLIGRLRGMAHFGAQMKEAEKFLETLRMQPEWRPPVVQRSASVFNLEQAEDYVRRCQSHEPEPLIEYLATVLFRQPGVGEIPHEWLQAEWRLGCDDGGNIVIPYYGVEGQLFGHKFRDADMKPKAAPGMTLSDFYGVWRMREGTTVVLTEGESDAWAASYALRKRPEFDVVSLPRGVGDHPVLAPTLEGRDVILAFDGDEHGREGALRWAVALRAAGAHPAIVPLPEGEDLSSLPDCTPYLLASRPLLPAPDAIVPVDGVYQRPGKEVNTPITNWSLDPEVELVGPNGASAYEGVLQPSGKRAVLSSYDLRNKGAAVNWALSHGGAWYGSDTDAQQLLGLLQASGPFLSPGRMEVVAGLHDGHFVWPGGHLGHDNWQYIDPPNSVHLAARMTLKEGPFAGAQVNGLRALHMTEVMDPILAWLAAAPLRSLFRAFPVLAVTGSSGSGKTTLLETVLENFTSTLITTNLTSTTPHALFSFVGSTNAFPVWFDEYRPGARRSTRESLQQVLRDAYTGQSSSKGGMGEKWSEVTTVPAIAPLIVSGEDAFAETSHTERMIVVPLPIRGKNPAVLEDIRTWKGHGLAYAYLSWLQRQLATDQLDLTVTPSGSPTWPARMRYNFGVLETGWRLLNEFCLLYGGEALGPLNWARIGAAGEANTHHNPVQDAILWALDEPSCAGWVKKDPRNGDVYLRVENFCQEIPRKGFDLPGGPAAIRSYLIEHYGASQVRTSFAGVQSRALVFKGAELGEGFALTD